MREAPSRTLLEALWEQGANVRAFDPEAMEETGRIYGNRNDLMLCQKPEDALDGADALVVVTEWNLFRSPDFDQIQTKLASPVIFDGRNIYDPEQLRSKGLTYYGIGRGES
jgi:UDPglucose 6-dehydrogenase